MSFQPDYLNILNSAKNIEAGRLPLYEHNISAGIMEKVMGCDFAGLYNGDINDKKEYFRNYNRFFYEMGYDTVTFETCIGPVMPGSGALGGHKDGVIKDRIDFDNYPWDEIPDLFFKAYSPDYEALRATMPHGMKGIGGPGNGIFECVQDIVGFMDLCYIAEDDPELYKDLFRKVGETNLAIWERFLEEFADIYCVLRFGDDLGFKSSTLLKKQDVKALIIPEYRKIIEKVHMKGMPFLLHSCGNIFDVMEDLISVAKIDAKHSNEDQIAPFYYWVEKYGDRIGNFGGIDTDAVCRLDYSEMKEYIDDVVSKCKGHGGFAFGSGNSIPDYVSVEGYLNMIRIVREIRGEDLKAMRYL
ncbi:MAG: uroporphyrinogen decarboxylase family protein [Saccharofermentanales bacterium]